MNRRAVLRLGLAVVLLAGSLASVATAADLPVVRQPNDPAYSAADRTALAAAWAAVDPILAAGTPIPAFRLVQNGWSERDFLLFAAGTLQSAGYSVFLATGALTPGVEHTWLLVGVALPGGTGYL
ncbi:MAG: hypothetical protein AB1778_10075, partial [Candidatus Bipolaricaulota bacterium]